ncbi:hypothetical protein [Pseudoxanthomonas sp. PXM02]|uniref:hypothetical protein n=1 Tax=Pseudoxanthomonas sp. PXM02 TaxID=2769294 RepID=UPI001781AB36|nr:hypothetical protein [Pseudoxanthomonas sp. PXM02]MBD9480564.1 hypothetical protein [Pseudoxanthomonas sp. PXM02]
MGPRWLLGMCLLAASAGATVPTTHYCGQQVCVALADHPDLEFKDTYVHTAKEGIEHRVIRYMDGTVLSVLMSPKPRMACKTHTIDMQWEVNGDFTGIGCAKGLQGMPDRQIYVLVRQGNADLLHFFGKTGLHLWTTGRDSEGRWHAFASEIVAVRVHPWPN